MESLFVKDFSAVRVHEGPEAGAAGARAFTRGNDVHFAPGQYAPDTAAGQELLGHELSHVVQQAEGRVAVPQAKGSAVNQDEALEREADEHGARAARGEAITRRGASGAPATATADSAVQCKLEVNGEDVSADKIQRAGAFKTRLNKIISEEARRAKRTPSSVRNKLVDMANDQAVRSFSTLRDAVDEAISTGLIEAQSELSEEMDDHDEFDDFPRDQSWRLLMDGKHQGRGKVGFENEPGYMPAMMKGFTEMLATLGQRLTADGYEALHDLCVDGVKDRHGEDMDSGFRNSGTEGEGFGLDSDNWSQDGHDELIEKYSHKNSKDPRYPDGRNPVGDLLAVKKHPDELKNERVFRVRPLYANRCKGLADLVLNLYYQEIDDINQIAPNDQTAKMTAIVRCCQDLDQLHLFVDGNIRTIVFLVLNKLLIENGLSPVIMNEPNVFDCKSIAELLAAVRRGQQAFQSMRRT
jgi:hypothetical protein